MSDILTRLRLPGSTAFKGIMDRGARDAADMINQVRRYGEHLSAQAEEIQRAADSAFQIDVVRGSCVQRHVRTIQEAADAAD